MAEILNLPKLRQRSKPVPPKEAFPHNLPVQPTPFIGREQELSEIEKLLSDPVCRLLTLVGPGGIGKTRLALEAASQCLGDYPNGVWFVPFVGVSSPEHMVSTLADSLKFSFYGPADPKVQVLNYLKEKKMLLLLDNFEHLLGGAGLVSEILTTASGVKSVVTSRELLKLKEEWAFQVKGLNYPKGESPEEAVEDYSAVKLFLQGAKRSDTSFCLSQEDKPFLVQVLQGVEGMPLGIELASSWVRALSVKEIAKEVEKNLAFFAAERKDIPARHRNLQAVFEQSWGMLTKEEQRSFRRMSVFRGGFQRDAAEKVAGATLPVIAGLIDKSFIRKAPSGRYEVHELMRQFGEGKLKGVAGEKKKVQDYHSEYYLEFLYQCDMQFNEGSCKEAHQKVGEEIDNIRAGWGLAVEQRDLNILDKTMYSFYGFVDIQNRYQEGQKAYGDAVNKLQGRYNKTKVFARLLMFQGWCFLNIGQLGKAKELFERGLTIFRRLKIEAPWSLWSMGELYCMLSEFEKAKPCLQESVRLCKTNENLFVKANSLGVLGEVLFSLDNIPEGIKCLQESLKIHRQDRGVQIRVAYCLYYLSPMLGFLGKLTEAKKASLEALAILNEIGDRRAQGLFLHNLSRLALAEGEYAEAKQRIQESLAIFKEIEDQWGLAWGLITEGLLSLALGDYKESKGNFQESMAIFKQIGIHSGIGYCLCGLGKVSEACEDYAEAKRLYKESLSLSRGYCFPLAKVDILKGLGEAACALGYYEEAEEWLKKALKKAAECELAFHVRDALTAFAGLLAKQGEKEKALEIIALVLHQSGCRKETQVRTEKLFSELKGCLPSQPSTRAKKRGEAKSIADAVEEILGERIEPLGEAKLRVSLLGPPKVFFGDREIPDKAWGLKRAKKLFCYLALLGEKGLPRDEVIEAFWPKAGPKKGLDSLYSSLTAIRKALKAEAGVEGQVVSLEEGRCGLDPKVEVYLDVEEFESLLRKGKQGKEDDQKKATHRALSLVRGRFCEGWYDSWVVEAERRVSEKHLEALKAFGMACLQEGKLEQSIACLEKALALDNLHEETCRSLMTAYAKAGKKKALLEAYANLKTRLKKELGAEPDPKTVELYEKLVR